MPYRKYKKSPFAGIKENAFGYFVKLAEAFGATGFRAETLDEFRDAMQKALAVGGPCLIDARIDKDERVLPFIPAGKGLRDAIID